MGIQDWYLMPPQKGPPLPRLFDLYWPWYKEELPGEEAEEEEGEGEEGEQQPPAADIQNIDLQVTAGEYAIGDKVPYSLDYEYKGKAQTAQLTLSIGTGVYPTFSTKQDYEPVELSLDEAMDWTKGNIGGTFVLTEALDKGQTYSLRGKLETLEDPTEETDTDWGVIEIPEEKPFEMEITDISTAKNKWLSSYLIAQVKGKIRNPNSSQTTHKVKCAVAYASQPDNFRFDRHWGFGSEGTPASQLIWLELTLQPGESVNVVSPYYYTAEEDTRHPDRGYEWADCYGQHTGYYAVLMDELGNKSEPVYFE